MIFICAVHLQATQARGRLPGRTKVLGFLPRRVPLSPFGLANLPNSHFVVPRGFNQRWWWSTGQGGLTHGVAPTISWIPLVSALFCLYLVCMLTLSKNVFYIPWHCVWSCRMLGSWNHLCSYSALGISESWLEITVGLSSLLFCVFVIRKEVYLFLISKNCRKV